MRAPPLEVLHAIIARFDVFVVVYFAMLTVSYAIQMAVGWREISDFVRRRPMRDYESVARSELSAPISILMPAYNEESVVIDSVRSLLGVNYGQFELVVINDGSSDGTLAALVREFNLVPVQRVARARLDCEPVRAIYVSPTDDRLVVIDKENGGKADAHNAGLCYARYPLFCAVDSDTLLEQDALQRLVWQFQVHPETVACGGIVRISNGSAVANAQVEDVRTPKSFIPNIQIVEYLRAFLVGRTGWSRMGMLLIISGAFGMFRREAVIEAGGFDRANLAEDAELIMRLHRHFRERRQPYRVAFIPDPVSWTQAPSSMRVLARQRDRWQRGLIQSLWRHRKMMLRPRYGVIGMVALPYFAIFEMLGAAIEAVGYPLMALSLFLGWISPQVGLAFAGLAVTAGLAFSFGALRIEERSFQRYRRWSCLARLSLAAVIENFGYRQFLTVVRARSFWTILRGRHEWGDMQRTPHEAAAAPTSATAPV